MNLIAKLLAKLRRGTATPDEIENLDRRLFCLGAVASAGTLIARPQLVDMGGTQSWIQIDGQKWWTAAGVGALSYYAHQYVQYKIPVGLDVVIEARKRAV